MIKTKSRKTIRENEFLRLKKIVTDYSGSKRGMGPLGPRPPMSITTYKVYWKKGPYRGMVLGGEEYYKKDRALGRYNKVTKSQINLKKLDKEFGDQL